MYPQPDTRRLTTVVALAITLFACLFGPVAAQSPVQVGSLTIAGAWARATPPAARTGAVYFTVTNTGAEPERLVTASSSIAATVEFHEHVMDGGVARMRAVDAIEIRPGEPALFQPGGLHVMLIDLRAPLRDGESIPVVLTFARAGTVTVDVPVRRTGPARAPAGHGHRHHGN